MSPDVLLSSLTMTLFSNLPRWLSDRFLSLAFATDWVGKIFLLGLQPNSVVKDSMACLVTVIGLPV